MKRRIHIFIIALAAVLAAPASALAETSAAEIRPGQERPVAVVTPRPGGVDIANASDSGLDIDIYAITGQQVFRGTATPGVTHVELRPGCYIVRVDGLSRRVAVN